MEWDFDKLVELKNCKGPKLMEYESLPNYEEIFDILIDEIQSIKEYLVERGKITICAEKPLGR